MTRSIMALMIALATSSVYAARYDSHSREGDAIAQDLIKKFPDESIAIHQLVTRYDGFRKQPSESFKGVVIHTAAGADKTSLVEKFAFELNPHVTPYYISGFYSQSGATHKRIFGRPTNTIQSNLTDIQTLEHWLGNPRIASGAPGVIVVENPASLNANTTELLARFLSQGFIRSFDRKVGQEYYVPIKNVIVIFTKLPTESLNFIDAEFSKQFTEALGAPIKLRSTCRTILHRNKN